METDRIDSMRASDETTASIGIHPMFWLALQHGKCRGGVSSLSPENCDDDRTPKQCRSPKSLENLFRIMTKDEQAEQSRPEQMKGEHQYE